MRFDAADAARRQYERTYGDVREVSERAARPRRPAVARRTRSAHLRKCLRSGMEALGRADEDDSQRVPADAVAEGSARPRREAYGGFLLWRRRGAPARLRPATGEVIRF